MAATELAEVPITLLDAVNALLRSVGIAEVDSLLDTDANVDSQNAFTALNRANAQIQAKGWYCNTEDLTFAPDVNQQVKVATNWLRVRATRYSATWTGKNIVTRGGFVYDLKAHTNKFTSDKALFLEVVQSLAFEDLPQSLRWYITCRAGRMFAVGTYPSSGTFQFTADEELKAKAEAEQEDEMIRDQTGPEASPYFAQMRRGRGAVL